MLLVVLKNSNNITVAEDADGVYPLTAHRTKAGIAVLIAWSGNKERYRIVGNGVESMIYDCHTQETACFKPA